MRNPRPGPRGMNAVVKLGPGSSTAPHQTGWDVVEGGNPRIADERGIGKTSNFLDVTKTRVIAAQPAFAPTRRVGSPRLWLGNASVPRLGGSLHQSGGRR